MARRHTAAYRAGTVDCGGRSLLSRMLACDVANDLGDLVAVAAGMAALIKRPERIRGYATGSGSGCHAVAETNI